MSFSCPRFVSEKAIKWFWNKMLHFQVHHASFKVNKNLFRKTINIFFMDLLAQDGPIAPNKFFSEKKHIVYMYLLAPCICKFFKKVLWVDPQFGRHVILGPKMVHLSHGRTFCRKTISIILIFWPVSLCEIQKGNQSGSRVMGRVILGPKMAQIPQEKFFSEKPLIYFWCTSWTHSLCKI